jgi:hypothetical protein
MTLNIPAFRTAFPEFASTVEYPTELITLWAGVAEQMVPCKVWKNMWTVGVSLYVAHEITLEAQSRKAASVGGVPGQNGGVASTKTVGSVSVGYDPNTTTEKDAGYWNLTTYGKQFIRLARIFGAGAIQLIGGQVYGPGFGR